jgi:isoquinoline 1-oxidoreductase subunit alpha
MSFKINVNGRDYEVHVPGEMPLLWVLRDELGLSAQSTAAG